MEIGVRVVEIAHCCQANSTAPSVIATMMKRSPAVDTRLRAFHGASRNQLPINTSGKATADARISQVTHWSGMIASPANRSAACSSTHTDAT